MRIAGDSFAQGWFGVVVIALGVAGFAAGACSSSHGASAAPDADDTGSDAAGDTAAPLPSNDAGADGSPDDTTPPPPQTYVRIAHASPDSPPIDVCMAPHGTTSFQGPLLGELAASLAGGAEGGTEADGGAPGIAYSQVSAYVPLAPGQYDVLIVAAGATSCAPADAGGDASSPVSAFTNLPVLAFNTHATLLIAGDLSPAGSDAPLGVTVLPDDAVLAGGAVVLRAINAVPSEPALDFGLGSGTAWAALLTDVSFGSASAQAGPSEGAVDRNGYIAIGALSTGTLSARASSSDAATDTAVATGVEIDFGSIATVIAIGGKTGDAANPPALLLCMDNQPSGGLLSDCSVAQ